MLFQRKLHNQKKQVAGRQCDTVSHWWPVPPAMPNSLSTICIIVKWINRDFVIFIQHVLEGRNGSSLTPQLLSLGCSKKIKFYPEYVWNCIVSFPNVCSFWKCWPTALTTVTAGRTAEHKGQALHQRQQCASAVFGGSRLQAREQAGQPGKQSSLAFYVGPSRTEEGLCHP